MQWFHNLKIQSKLLSVVAVLLLLTMVVGYYGYSGLSTIIPNFDSMYKDRLIPVIQMFSMSQHIGEIRIKLRTHIRRFFRSSANPAISALTR